MHRYCLLLLSVPLCAAPVVLYDGTSHPNTQGWTAGTPAGTMASGYVNLDTTANSALQTGYGRFLADGAVPFRYRFDVRVNSESHAFADRSGFAAIVINSAGQGVELGFWDNEIWAQNAGFTHGEGVSRSTAAMTRYDLYLSSTGYQLFADGSPVLSGALRTYGVLPYLPNFVFLGDDTQSANANIDLSYVEFEAGATPTPEPGTWMAGIGLLALAARSRFR